VGVGIGLGGDAGSPGSILAPVTGAVGAVLGGTVLGGGLPTGPQTPAAAVLAPVNNLLGGLLGGRGH
jgi:hypothetical protein